MTGVGAKEKNGWVTEKMENARLGMKKLDTKRLGILFLKHILHHFILEPVLSTKINSEMLKKLLVPNICHIEIIIYIKNLPLLTFWFELPIEKYK